MTRTAKELMKDLRYVIIKNGKQYEVLKNGKLKLRAGK